MEIPTAGLRSTPGSVYEGREGGIETKVYLVGAGPGDPSLMTARAERVVGSADIVLRDSLVDEGAFEDASGEVVDVGKRSSDATQDGINKRMARRYDDGCSVARLKGGDPYVFGRGGEEAEYLDDEGVPYEVVPGVSSVLAAPAALGIPLTHRACSSSFTVVTGHEDPEKDDSALDWDALATNVSTGGTLVILMGVGRMSTNTRRLVEGGVDPGTPAAVVERATWDDERSVVSTVSGLADECERERIEPPAVTVVGDVVGTVDDGGV